MIGWVLRRAAELLGGLIVWVGLWIVLLRWVPLPPVGYGLDLLSGRAPQWGWVGDKAALQRFQRFWEAWEEIEAVPAREAVSLGQRAAEAYFYPPTLQNKSGSHLIGALVTYVWGTERLWVIYLNSLAFSKGVYGVGAAAERFFEKPLHALNSEELSELVVRRRTGYWGSPLPLSLHLAQKRLQRRLAGYDS
ncbi:MAG: transglycosylase domain-containing protein [Bacteroidia bacterium]|nr:transglycosylase domain-containing protein [Bacteroidia bacterium]MDW8089535.1 transglycosylase domain-containing protein [Bacteroidia bacterium]